MVYLQPHVVSLRGAEPREWTLVTSAGKFAWGSKLERSFLPQLRSEVLFASPLFSFRVRDMAPGSSTVVTITPGGLFTDRFFEFDPTAATRPGAPFWTDFPTDLLQGIRANVSAEQIALHLEDGKSGDLDGQRDGFVTVLGGAPRFGANQPVADYVSVQVDRLPLTIPITGQITAVLGAS